MTPRSRVLDATRELEEENDGWPVPLELIARRAGLASRSTAHHHMENLLREGLVERSPFDRGGYRVTRRKEPDGRCEGEGDGEGVGVGRVPDVRWRDVGAGASVHGAGGEVPDV